MASKRKLDVIDEMRKLAEFRWEALRRNDDYKAEYKSLFRAVYDPEVSSENIKTGEDWERYENYNNEFTRKYGEAPCVSKKDLEAIRHIASNPNKVFKYGNLHIVAMCEIWGIRYPKNPDEDFKPRKDHSLFLNHYPVNVLNHYAEFEAYGEHRALDMMEFYLKKRPLVQQNGEVTKWSEGLLCETDRLRFAEVVKWVRNDSQELEKIGQRQREAGHIMFLVNVNHPKEVILAHIAQHLDSFKKGRTKKRRRLPDWRSFNAWDLKQKGMFDSEIANVIGHTGVRTISSWRKKVKKMIAKEEETRNAHRDKDGNYML